MKLTPLDIHQKEFRHGLRGYVEEEVDQFLDQVASELERLFKENIDLSDKIEQLQAKVDEYDVARHTINNTLLTAQRSADEIVVQAKIDAENMVTQATADAEATVKQAQDHAASIEAEMARQHRELVAEIARVRQLEESFRADFRAVLDKHASALAPMAVPADVERLLDAASHEPQADVEPATAQIAEETTVLPAAQYSAPETPAEAPEIIAEPALAAEPAAPAPEPLEPEAGLDARVPVEDEFASGNESESAADPEPLDVFDEAPSEPEPVAFVPEPQAAPVQDADRSAAAASPTPPWFDAHPEQPVAHNVSVPAQPVVSSIVLGEIESEADAVSFETQVMGEISLPGFDALGELDEDVEEID